MSKIIDIIIALLYITYCSRNSSELELIVPMICVPIASIGISSRERINREKRKKEMIRGANQLQWN